MWKFSACFCSAVVAFPYHLECNDPRFDPGYVVMGTPTKESSTDFTVDATSYTSGSSVRITFSGLGGGAQLGLRVLPKLGYSGHYGSFSSLSRSLALQGGNCPNTIISSRVTSSGSVTWTASPETYGDVDLTLLWGSNVGLSYQTITLSGPPIPNHPPAFLAQTPGDATNNITEAYTKSRFTSQAGTGQCVAPTDGTYNLPNAPVFHQKLKSKTVVFPTGQCLPCRDDQEDKCLSARVECPAQPGDLAVQHLFMSEDCSDQATISSLPTKFVYCPGPEHYSPDKLDLERFVKKLQRDHASYFPNEATTRLALAEYRRMLHIIQKFPDMPAVPSKLVDLVWHEHILDTQTYRHDSQRLFGKYIHHAPSFGDEADDDVKAEKLEMVDQQLEMLEQYLELFGEHPNVEIWPLSSQGKPAVMGAGRLPDCCKAACVKVDCVTCVGCNAVDCGKLSAEAETATLKQTHVLPEYFAGYVPLPHELENEIPAASQTTYLCHSTPMTGMTLSWTISGDNIYMQQSLDTSIAETWHAVGFTNVSPFNMGYADYIVSFFAGNYSTSGPAPGAGVRDLYKYDAGNHYPCWDVLTQCSLDGQAGTQDLQDRVTSRFQGMSTSSWYRLLDTGDYKDAPITDASQCVMFAYGVDDEFTYHGFNARQTCSVNFFTGAVSCGGFGCSAATFV